MGCEQRPWRLRGAYSTLALGTGTEASALVMRTGPPPRSQPARGSVGWQPTKLPLVSAS